MKIAPCVLITAALVLGACGGTAKNESTRNGGGNASLDTQSSVAEQNSTSAQVAAPEPRPAPAPPPAPAAPSGEEFVGTWSAPLRDSNALVMLEIERNGPTFLVTYTNPFGRRTYPATYEGGILRTNSSYGDVAYVHRNNSVIFNGLTLGRGIYRNPLDSEKTME